MTTPGTERFETVDYDFSRLGFRRGDVVVVTGAANGIGEATAALAARSGLAVSCWDVDEARLHEVVSRIGAAGGEAVAVCCDVTDPGAVSSAWAVTAELGPPRYLVNNAGPPSSSSFSVARGLSLAVGSMAAVTEEWLALFADTAEAVTFTASIAGNFVASPNGSRWYVASKAAIAAYARELAVHCKGRPRANVIAPGMTATARTTKLMDSARGRALVARIPLARLGTPEESAAVICFLLSPAASYVNGVCIAVDGGAVLAP